MKNRQPFVEFAPTILKSYSRDPEEFWAAVMAPFLNNSKVLTFLQHSKISLEFITLFKEVDNEAKKTLVDYSMQDGFDITKWQSLKSKDEYFKDAYPIYAFLVIWMKENGLYDILDRFSGILQSVVYGIAGYGILDVLVDGTYYSPVELLEAQALIAEYETRILNVFGVTSINLDILHRIRDKYLKAEIKEKSLRNIKSPYNIETPIQCGYKAAHLLTPFMMSLDRLGRSAQIDTYFEVFFKFGAVIQIIDDLKDLEEDLSIGHYSYVTLGTDAILLLKSGQKPKQVARLLLTDPQHLLKIYLISKKLIAESNNLLENLDDPFLMRIVKVTELRLDSFFCKDLNLRLGAVAD